MHYRLNSRVLADLLSIAQKAAPQEACGFAFGGSHQGIIEFYSANQIPNISATPLTEFLIDGTLFRHAYQMAERAHLCLAIWHSHPDSKPTPSQQDFTLIKQLDIIPFIIVGLEPPVITIYECEDGRVREAERFVLPEVIHAGA